MVETKRLLDLSSKCISINLSPDMKRSVACKDNSPCSRLKVNGNKPSNTFAFSSPKGKTGNSRLSKNISHALLPEFNNELTKMIIRETSSHDFPSSSTRIVVGFCGDYVNFADFRQDIETLLEKERHDLSFEVLHKQTSCSLNLLAFKLSFLHTRVPDFDPILAAIRKTIINHSRAGMNTSGATEASFPLRFSQKCSWVVLDSPDSQFARILNQLQTMRSILINDCSGQDANKASSNDKSGANKTETALDNYIGRRSMTSDASCCENRLSLLSIRVLCELLSCELEVDRSFTEICLLSCTDFFEDIIRCNNDLFYIFN
ncbi:MAG: hypothetical protein MHMPM18_000917 [Marteilia pararefringens]